MKAGNKVLIVVGILILASLACNSADLAGQVLDPNSSLNATVSAPDFAVQTAIAGNTPTPTPITIVSVPPTPTSAPILNSATACGKSDFKVGNRQVGYIESDPETFAVRYSLGGLEQPPVPNGYAGWVLADVYLSNTNGCLVVAVSGN